MALFNRQKAEKGKCKGQESTIGKVIYSFLLFMPILAVGVACLYAILNKNAYQSYSEKNITNAITINSTNNTLLVTGENYLLDFKNPIDAGTGNQINYTFTYTDISVNLRDYFDLSYDIDGLGISSDANYTQYFRLYVHRIIDDKYIALNGGNIIRYNGNFFLTKLQDLSFKFTLNTFSQDSYRGFLFTKIYYTYGSLDNVFYYQLNKLEESDLFNWTKNTGTYDVIHNTTALLGITNTYMPMLLTYWLIISVIYFVYDIGLMLVWVMHRKIHELQESI